MSGDPENTDQLTDLVSYLDSELDQTRMNEIEMQLLNDPSMRTLADQLDRSWGLLDSLDEVSVDPQFTQKTLASVSSEMAAQASASGGEAQPAGPGVKLRQFITSQMFRTITGWLIAGNTGTTMIGLTIGRIIQQKNSSEQDESILREQDLLLNYPRYSSVPGDEELNRLPIHSSKSGQPQESE